MPLLLKRVENLHLTLPAPLQQPLCLPTLNKSPLFHSLSSGQGVPGHAEGTNRSPRESIFLTQHTRKFRVAVLHVVT